MDCIPTDVLHLILRSVTGEDANECVDDYDAREVVPLRLCLRLVCKRWGRVLSLLPISINITKSYYWSVSKLSTIFHNIVGFDSFGIKNPHVICVSDLRKISSLTELRICSAMTPNFKCWPNLKVLAIRNVLGQEWNVPLVFPSRLELLEIDSSNPIIHGRVSSLVHLSSSLMHLALRHPVLTLADFESIVQLTRLKFLDVRSIKEISHLQMLSNIPSLEGLRFSTSASCFSKSAQVCTEVLPLFTQLTSLETEGYGTYGDPISALSVLTRLRLLRLNSHVSSQSILDAFCKVTAIRDLHLSGPKLDIPASQLSRIQSATVSYARSDSQDRTIHQLCTSSSLKSLSLILDPNSVISTAPFSQLRQLESLKMLGTSDSSPAVVCRDSFICFLRNLRTVEFRRLRGPIPIESLVFCQRLHTLEISNVPHASANDEIMASVLRYCSQLTSLALHGSGFRGECFAGCHPKLKLTNLSISFPPSKSGADAIERLPCLQAFSLIVDNTTAARDKRPELVIPLHIRSGSLTALSIPFLSVPADLERLTQNWRLRCLRVATFLNVSITPAMLFVHLSRMKCLTEVTLNLGNSSNVDFGTSVTKRMRSDFQRVKIVAHISGGKVDISTMAARKYEAEKKKMLEDVARSTGV